MADLFNNDSNNYVYPALSPCAGAGDNSYLEFLPNETIGIIKGADILASINFSDIKIPVSAYSIQSQILGAGEVVFIGGLSKGLQNRTQGFLFPYLTQSTINPYFMEIDLSIGFYRNFKYVNLNLEASGNYANGIGIDTALSLALSNLTAKVEALYDPSNLNFTGTQEGYDYKITNVNLTLIDASQDASSPFLSLVIDGSRVSQTWVLEENLDLEVPYAKYPNSAMQGIILKGTFPNISTITEYDKWFYVNHVGSTIILYDPLEIDNYITNLQKTVTITFDPSIIFGPFIDTDVSADIENIEPSIGLIDTIYAKNCVFRNIEILNSSIYGSIINDDSSTTNSVIENSWINAYILIVDPSTLDKIYIIDDPTIPESSLGNRVPISLSTINDCSINNSVISDTSIFNSFLIDVSLIRCTLYNCLFDVSTVTFNNCRNIRINEFIDTSVSYTLESSTYYSQSIKTINICLNGESTSTEMSAGDYLDYINTNGYWSKVGQLYIWTSAPDFTDTQNLINGFYAFNPHDFSIQLDYLLFV